MTLCLGLVELRRMISVPFNSIFVSTVSVTDVWSAGAIQAYSSSTCFASLLHLWTTGQTDLAVEELEAQSKAITLIEDFTGFDPQLPDPR